MIHSFVVHLVVNDLVGDDLVGVVEDVAASDRHHFRTADGLLAHLVARTASNRAARAVELPSSTPDDDGPLVP